MKTTYKVVIVGEDDIPAAEFDTYAEAFHWAQGLINKGWYEVRVEKVETCLWDCT